MLWTGGWRLTALIIDNPISVIIPCHRVVGTNKSLTGYAGGIDRKIKLLKHERVDMSEFLTGWETWESKVPLLPPVHPPISGDMFLPVSIF